MELDAHVDRLALRGESLVGAWDGVVTAANKRAPRNLNGFFLPELYIAERRLIREMGKTTIELLKLAPHAPELYQLYKQRKSGTGNGRS